ncbi:ribonucleases P/MRP protein subunit Pop6p [Monosporozyma servazzii]
MSTKVLYSEHPTDLDLTNQVQSYKYIQEIIIPNLLVDDNKLLTCIKYFKVTKNDKIKSILENLQKHQQTGLICLYGYGPHLQKLLSIIELYKTKILDNTPFKQYNKLTSFDVISQGRNELLDRKTKVPILISFFTINEAFFNLDTFTNEKYGFTEQA